MLNARDEMAAVAAEDDALFHCPICLEVFLDPTTVSPCGHSACRHCITSWLDRGNTRCPSCSTAISQVCLSFALREITMAVHGAAVAQRRDALGLPPSPPSFSRIVPARYAPHRVVQVMMGADHVVLKCAALVVLLSSAIAMRQSNLLPSGGSDSHITSAAFGIALGLAALISYVGLDNVAAPIRGGEQAADPDHGRDDGAAMNRGLPQQQRWVMLPLPRWGRPMGFFAAVWLILVAVFYVIIVDDVKEMLDELDEGSPQRVLERTGSMMVQVFVITFVVVFCCLMFGHWLVRQLRR